MPVVGVVAKTVGHPSRKALFEMVGEPGHRIALDMAFSLSFSLPHPTPEGCGTVV